MDLNINVSETISLEDLMGPIGFAEFHEVNKHIIMVEGRLYICLTGEDGFPFYTAL